MKKIKELSPWETVIRKRIISLIDDYCGGSQKKFVDKTGLNKGSVSQYVNGKNTPSWDNAEKIAAAFNIDVKWIMGVDTVPDPVPDDTGAIEFMNLYLSADPLTQKTVVNFLKSAKQDS